MRQLQIWVPGTPQSQGSMAMFTDRKGRKYLTSTNPKLRSWREAIAKAVKEHNPDFRVTSAAKVVLLFHLPKPPTVKRLLPWCRPDIDKLSRAVLDALTDGGVWTDDGRVVELCAEKVYAEKEPGVFIRVEERNETLED